MSEERFLLNRIKTMDVASDEFFEIYKLVNEKYWTFDDPDDEQKARFWLHMITERGEPKHVILLVKMYEQMIPLFDKGGTVAFELGFDKSSYFVRVSDQADGFDKMKKMIENTVVVKSKPQFRTELTEEESPNDEAGT